MAKLQIKTSQNSGRKHEPSELELATGRLSQRLRELGISNPRQVIAGLEIEIAKLPESELKKIFGDFEIKIIEVSEVKGKGK